MKSLNEYLNEISRLFEAESFSEARALIIEASDRHPSAAEPWWLYMLCSRYLKNDEELIATGVPIDSDLNYQEARKLASDEEKKRFDRVRRKIGERAVEKMKLCIEAKDGSITRRWQNRLSENKVYAKRHAAPLAFAEAAQASNFFSSLPSENIEKFTAAVKVIEASGDKNTLADLNREKEALYTRIFEKIKAAKAPSDTLLSHFKTITVIAPERREPALTILKLYDTALPEGELYTLCYYQAHETAESEEEKRTLERQASERLNRGLRDTKRAALDALRKKFDSLTNKDSDPDTPELLRKLGRELEAFAGFEDADALRARVFDRADAIEKKQKRKKFTKRFTIVGSSVAAIVIALLLFIEIIPSIKISQAEEMMAKGNYADAVEILGSIEGYRRTPELLSEARYALALEHAESGRAFEAYVLFNALGSYRDSAERLDALDGALDAIKAGDTLTFGSYEQNDSRGDRVEPIEWIVLHRDGDVLFMISRYVLDADQMQKDPAKYTGFWEPTELCEWLNGKFADKAFGSAEKSLFAAPSDLTPNQPLTKPLFFLSRHEYELFYKSDKITEDGGYADGIAYPTKAAAKDRELELYNGACSWWLRDQGFSWNYASYVNPYGKVNIYETSIGHQGVRPCVRVDIGK